MPKLVRWDTPFSETQFPSVGLIITSRLYGIDILKAVVAPNGNDAYPKYLVDFGEAVAFTCFEEAHAPKRDFASARIEEEHLCAYEYLESSWLKSYAAWSPLYFGNQVDSFYHYLIFGGDNNIEVITANRPAIAIVEENTILKIEYEV